MDKGIYDMISKGLIPKSADITPAMSMGGNPFSIRREKFTGKNINKLYSKEEVITGPMNKFKFNQYEIDEIYNIKKKLPSLSKDWTIKQKRNIPYYHETIPDNNNKQILQKVNINNNDGVNNNTINNDIVNNISFKIKLIKLKDDNMNIQYKVILNNKDNDDESNDNNLITICIRKT